MAALTLLSIFDCSQIKVSTIQWHLRQISMLSTVVLMKQQVGSFLGEKQCGWITQKPEFDHFMKISLM